MPTVPAVLAMLLLRPVLRPIADEANANTLAGRAAFAGKSAELMASALDALARDAQAEADNGGPWLPSHMAKQAAKYLDREVKRLPGPSHQGPPGQRPPEAPSFASSLPFKFAPRPDPSGPTDR